MDPIRVPYPSITVSMIACRSSAYLMACRTRMSRSGPAALLNERTTSPLVGPWMILNLLFPLN